MNIQIWSDIGTEPPSRKQAIKTELLDMVRAIIGKIVRNSICE
ncbi:hypothetical protein ACFL0H_14375 [Thermodesulfobacteriota bacterium]